ncbi:MAG: exo-alpha-sialidase, partial [Planctomycetaceae bacterium]|nr:exo-alpha-sialidase [Planctomycetaceae bacterium]
MDFDGDGDLDLVVSCPDKPHNGVYFFENPGTSRVESAKSSANGSTGPSTRDTQHTLPVLKPAVRLGPAVGNIQVSYVDGDVRLLAPGVEYRNFREKIWDDKVSLGLPAKIDAQYQRTRANQWKYVDFDGDGDLDVIVGLGVWDDYGWDDAWDETGNWKNGPLHGFVYLVERIDESSFREPVKLATMDGAPVDVYGMPSPNFADFDGDGDLDLLCGEFLDGFTYFQNVGTRTEPRYAPGVRIKDATGREVRMDLQMIMPVAIDWDGDGDQDLICGDEDGRVAFIEHTGIVQDGAPVYAQPIYFQQEAADVKFGALVTPVGVDWDGDGDEDLICGNTAGYIGFIENLGGGTTPKWASPRRLLFPAGSFVGDLRHEAGAKGSIQGPCEAKWGYTTLSVADWNNSGESEVVVNDIWGKVAAYRVIRDVSQGSHNGVLVPEPVTVAWESDPSKPAWTWWKPRPNELATQWRTTPNALDWNGDGLTDLVMLDHEGYLAFYERAKQGDELVLLPPQRVFKIEGPCEFDGRHQKVGDKTDDLLRLNAGWAGKSGRRKMCFADWDGDGRVDLLVNSVNANWLRNVRTDDEGFTWFADMGPLDERVLAGHDTSPTVVDWDQNGIPDLLVGAEDGYFYYKRNPRAVLAQSEPRPSGRGYGGDIQFTAAAVADAPGAEGIVGSEFIYTEAPFPQCHATTIAETPTGLVAAWFGGTHENHPDVGIWVARHVNGEWTPPVEVANGVQHTTLRYPCWNPVLNQVPNGPLLLFYKVGPSPRAWWGMLTESTDGGVTWSFPRRLPEQIDGPVKNKGEFLSDGRLLCPSSTEYDGWRVHFEVTTDNGRTWERIGPINDGKTFNAIQPSILIHQDGKLQVLCRSREGNIVTSWSEDGGRSWSDVVATSLPNPNSGTDAVTLKDGRHLLVYNHTRRGSGDPQSRALLNVAVSDDGRNWQAALVLE